MGGILLVISAAVIIVVAALLFNDVDNSLDAAHKIILSKIKVNDLGRIATRLETTDISSNIYVQVWGLDGELQSSFGRLEDFSTKPFDPNTLHADRSLYRDISENGLHIRVLSVPLQQRGHVIAVLQIASSLEIADTARMNLTDFSLGSLSGLRSVKRSSRWEPSPKQSSRSTVRMTSRGASHTRDQRMMRSGTWLGHSIKPWKDWRRFLLRSSASWQMSATSCELRSLSSKGTSISSAV